VQVGTCGHGVLTFGLLVLVRSRHVLFVCCDCRGDATGWLPSRCFVFVGDSAPIGGSRRRLASAGAGILVSLLLSGLSTNRISSFFPTPLVMLTSSLYASAFFMVVFSCISFALGLRHVAASSLSGGIVTLCIAYTSHSSRIVRGLWCCFLLHTVSTFAINWWLARSVFGPRNPIQGYMAGALAAGITIHRLRALRASKKLLEGDERKYSQLWDKVCSDEDNMAGIKHLEKVVRMVGLDDISDCRQHNRLLASHLPAPLKAKFLSHITPEKAAQVNPLLRELGRWYISGRADPQSQIVSLNQVYFQAAIANLILIERIKAWASQSSGMFRLEGDEDIFRDWNEIKADPRMVAKVCWTLMKGHDRSIEKLVRSYGSRPSRLVDIARSAIVFRSMENLTNCLGLIVTDHNVRVERLKNRLSLSYDAASETGGYRDVCVNLKMVDTEANTLGVELHLCEVQLILIEFAHVKNIGECLRDGASESASLGKRGCVIVSELGSK